MKTYTITFKANLTEEDVKAMKSCFYDAMNESMEIMEVWGLELKEETDNYPDRKDEPREFKHIRDVENALYDCVTINEVNELLDNVPRKFGEWYVDIVMGLDGKAYYEVTNDYYEYGELQVKTYDLEIEVEDED